MSVRSTARIIATDSTTLVHDLDCFRIFHQSELSERVIAKVGTAGSETSFACRLPGVPNRLHQKVREFKLRKITSNNTIRTSHDTVSLFG